jgi:hypothetical protein
VASSNDTNSVVSRVEELDAARLQERFAGLGLTSIADVAERQPVRIAGEIRGLARSGYDDSPWMSITINDGTGKAVAVFNGRRRIWGLDSGRTVIIEGVGGRDRGELVIHNPAYTIVGRHSAH